MHPSIDIIIVNWNAGDLLFECIDSIGKSIKSIFELKRVVVIDNASNDNSIEKIKSIDLPLIIIKNSCNMGFARASNQGAKDSNADFLLFLNPDTKLFEDSLCKPIEFMLQQGSQNYGIIGIRIINEKNETTKNCARFPSPFNFIFASIGLSKLFPNIFQNSIMEEWDHNASMIVDHVMGSFFLVRRNIFEKLNGFDERFFVYLEDLDFSLRAKKLGFISYYLSTASVYHKGGGTSEKVKANRLSYILHSKLVYSHKHFSKPAFITIFFVTFFLEPFFRIAYVLIQGIPRDASEIIKGYKKLVTKFISNKFRF